MYSLIACNDLEVNKAKGVNLKLKHEEYLDVSISRGIVRQNEKNTVNKVIYIVLVLMK